MKYNKAVKILNEVSRYQGNRQRDFINTEWNRLNTHWEDNGYFTHWGHVLGGTDNEEESREELLIYIKPYDYPTLDEELCYVIDGLAEFYQDAYIEEFSDEDIEAINNGRYQFDDFVISVEWRDFEDDSNDISEINNHNELINIIDEFIQTTEEYQIDYERNA